MVLGEFLNKDSWKCSSFNPFSRVVTVKGTIRFVSPTDYLLNLTMENLIDLSFPYYIAIRLIVVLWGLQLLMKWEINSFSEFFE